LNDAEQANRVVVMGGVGGTQKLATIDDPSKVQAAVAFLKQHPDGWRESWNAGGGGEFNLMLYRGDHLLGMFGLTPSVTPDGKRSRTSLVSVGGVIQRIDTSEVDALAHHLGLKWPSER